jgi:hypothetical protein
MNSFAFITALLLAATAASAQSIVTVKPVDNGVALVNPDMGWVVYFYSNVPTNYGSQLEPSDTVDDFPGASTVFMRIPWSMVEPEEGKFNWAILDTPAQRWISKGKKIALDITCSENWIAFGTPEWVKNAGAKGTFYAFGKGPSPVQTAEAWCWDPDFGDPIFLAKLDAFYTAMAARYDGDPNVAYISMGSYGLWGEGHTFMTSQVPEDKADKIVRKHIDMLVKHFPNTRLNVGDDLVGHDKPGRHFPLTDYALSKDMGLRDDSIMVQPPPRQWYHSEMAQEFWPKAPVVLEHEHYLGARERGSWGDGSRLLKAVEDYHASYMSIHCWPRMELDENRALIDRINLRIGYRLQLREISWPEKITIGEPFKVSSTWANAGVAPCYPGGFLAITIKDDKGGIVSVLSDESFDMRSLEVAAPGKAPAKSHESEFRVGLIAPTTKPGPYDVFVSVGKRNGTPVIALPLANDDGQRRYKLGQITIVEKK